MPYVDFPFAVSYCFVIDLLVTINSVWALNGIFFASLPRLLWALQRDVSKHVDMPLLGMEHLLYQLHIAFVRDLNIIVILSLWLCLQILKRDEHRSIKFVQQDYF